MTRLVVDDRTGRNVFVAEDRAARAAGDGACPFCPGGREVPGGARAPFAFPNRWPALPSGECTVVVHSDGHDHDFTTMSVEEIQQVVELWAVTRGQMLASSEVSTVLVFENRGAHAGATVEHAHSQVFGLPITPRSLKAPDGPCPSCAPVDPGLVVLDRGCWITAVPEAPLAPFSLRITPRRHVGALDELIGPEREALAESIQTSVRTMDRLFNQQMPYHLWVSQAGRVNPPLHLCVDIVGLLRTSGQLRILGAAETATGLAFTPMDPRTGADRLRHAVSEPSGGNH